MAFDKDDFIYIPTANLWFAKKRFYEGKNWDETWHHLIRDGLSMPTIEEFRVALRYLRDQKLSSYQNLYKEITDRSFSWKSNWLDAYFEKRSDGIYLLTKNRTKEDKLEDCLTIGLSFGVSLDQWLDGNKKSVTSQGFLKSPSEPWTKGNLIFYEIEGNCAARFFSDSNKVGINSGWGISSSDPCLGVFPIFYGSQGRFNPRTKVSPPSNYRNVSPPSTYRNPFEIDLPRIDKIENVVYGGKE